MSYYLIDFSKEHDFNFDNLIIGKKINSEQNYSKYYIYYDQNNTASEIYIKLPKLRSIYNLSNYKFNSLNIPIYPEFELTNNLIKFIKDLENNINECFKKKKEFISLITKKNSLQFIKMGINDKIKITSNTNNNIKISDFKINSELEIVIKLSYIWTNQNKVGLSSQIYQIKYYAPPDELNINFIDDESNITKKIINIPISYTPIVKPQLQLTQNNIIIRPSLTDINNALKSLKKIE